MNNSYNTNRSSRSQTESPQEFSEPSRNKREEHLKENGSSGQAEYSEIFRNDMQQAVNRLIEKFSHTKE